MAELLCPAGGKASLNAAVRAGADAVYLGLEVFNARINADNFSVSDISEVVEYCHLRDVKVYVTVNTLLITREVEEAKRLVEACVSAACRTFWHLTAKTRAAAKATNRHFTSKSQSITPKKMSLQANAMNA